MRALFLNHTEQKCGVYQMGRRIGRELAQAGVAAYVETWDLGTALAWVAKHRPRAVIYNWHPSTMPWAGELVRRYPAVKHVGLIHEIAPDAAAAGADVFPHRVVCDPSFPSNGRSLFRTVRHVPRYNRPRVQNSQMTVGSFGFAVGGKMFPTIVHAVGAEFPEAVARLRIPHAHYGDDAGDLARSAEAASRAVKVGGVRVEVEHAFLEDEALLDWLALNDLNVFFYEPNGGRGIASALDYAIAVRRPIAINCSQMFRHLAGRLGCYPKKSLRRFFETSAETVEDLYDTWTPELLVREYSDMLAVLGVS
jgi:hypothetical protein